MAKAITDLVNTVAPTVDYPYGQYKDETGINDGTPADVDMFNDMAQFFQKLMDEAGITPNSLRDNAANGFQLYEALMGVYPVRQKIIEIGAWDMNTTDSVSINHGLDYDKIRSVSAIVRNDANNARVQINGSGEGVISFIDSTKILLVRDSGGSFDSINYSDTGINRGFVTIGYIG